MSVELVKPSEEKPAEKPLKFRIDRVQVDQVIDCWRLLDRSQSEMSLGYPDLEAVNKDQIRLVLYQQMQLPNFIGFMARAGRKPIGQILGHVQIRPYGRPERFAFVWNFWVEPDCRSKGVMQELFRAFAACLRKHGIEHWEIEANDALVALLSEQKIQATPYSRRLAGKF